jgi:hypothetical protein
MKVSSPELNIVSIKNFSADKFSEASWQFEIVKQLIDAFGSDETKTPHQSAAEDTESNANDIKSMGLAQIRS